MGRIGQTILWIGLICALILGVLWESYPLPDASDRIESLPMAGEGFHGRDVPLGWGERQIYQNTHVAKRYYRLGENRFFLFAVDGTNNRHAIHDPAYCVTGLGWKAIKEKELSYAGGTVKHMRLQKDEMEMELVYWFSDGTNRYSSPKQYWIHTAVRRLTLGFSGPEPILVLLQSPGNRVPDWEAILKEFFPLKDL